TLLSGDVESAISVLAKRTAHLFRSTECVVVAQSGDRHVAATARGQEDGGLDPALATHCQSALDAGVPTLASTREGVVTLLGTHTAPPGGAALAYIVLMGERPHVYSSQTIDQLRALAQRLHVELAWRSVHERIAADRDRLRESSMFDPMLPGVWTRTALDQALAAEVAACQRRKEPMSASIIDLRGLKHVNERYGHIVGDEARRH